MRVNTLAIALACVPLAGATGLMVGFLARPAILPPRPVYIAPPEVQDPVVGDAQVIPEPRRLDQPMNTTEFEATVIGLTRQEIYKLYGRPQGYDTPTRPQDGPLLIYHGEFTFKALKHRTAVLHFHAAKAGEPARCFIVMFGN